MDKNSLKVYRLCRVIKKKAKNKKENRLNKAGAADFHEDFVVVHEDFVVVRIAFTWLHVKSETLVSQLWVKEVDITLTVPLAIGYPLWLLHGYHRYDNNNQAYLYIYSWEYVVYKRKFLSVVIWLKYRISLKITW